MKLCDTCIYGSKTEYFKPCIIYRDNCEFYEKERGDMTDDLISRQAVNTLVDELARAISDERCCMSRGRSTATIMQDILDLPPVNPQEPIAQERYEDLCEYFGDAKDILKNRDDFKAWLGRVKWHIHKAEELYEKYEQEPYGDLISRQSVLDKKELVELEDGQSFYCISPEDIETLIPVMSEPKTGHWIPVSERLPEDRREVLVTAYWHETYQVMMASYFGDGLWWCVPFNNCGEHMQRLKPRAWMTLPKPYEPQESEE